MTILGIIPARAGSQRVKNKNIRELGGKPLIYHTINAALQSKLLDRVIVSTDCPEIAQIAIDYGAEVPFMRPSELSNSDSTEFEFHEHALNTLYDTDSYKPDLIVNLYPTSPFRKPFSIDKAIKYLINNPSYSSLRSVTKCTEHPYKMWTKSGKEIKPFVNSKDSQEHTLSYQLLPEIFIQNACVYISRYDTIVNHKSTIGEKVLGFQMDSIEALDINSELDLLIAKTIIKSGQIK